jgi:hypothetical protein
MKELMYKIPFLVKLSECELFKEEVEFTIIIMITIIFTAIHILNYPSFS